jgi:hypothetical protein
VNTIDFNMADQVLPPQVQARLEQDYQTAIPEGAHAETGAHYERMVAALCERWNIDPRVAANAGAAFHCR